MKFLCFFFFSSLVINRRYFYYYCFYFVHKNIKYQVNPIKPNKNMENNNEGVKLLIEYAFNKFPTAFYTVGYRSLERQEIIPQNWITEEVPLLPTPFYENMKNPLLSELFCYLKRDKPELYQLWFKVQIEKQLEVRKLECDVRNITIEINDLVKEMESLNNSENSEVIHIRHNNNKKYSESTLRRLISKKRNKYRGGRLRINQKLTEKIYYLDLLDQRCKRLLM